MMNNFLASWRYPVLVSMTLIALALILTFCSPAYAQQSSCIPTEMLEHTLSEKHEEKDAVNLLVTSNPANVVRLFMNLNNNTWTLVVTKTDGTSCIIGAGDRIVFPSPVKVLEGENS